MSLPRVAVLASGRGSNFVALADEAKAGRLAVEFAGLITDLPGAPALERARERGIEALCIESSGRTPAQRVVHEEKLLAEFSRWNVRWLVLAGYMRVMTPRLIEAFRDPRGFTRIVNIHPALLPAFPGIHSYQQAWDHGVKVSGATVHLVEEAVDTGPILAQESFLLEGCRSLSDVEKRGLEVEHRLYARTLSWLCAEKFIVEKTATGRLRVLQG